MKRGGSEIRGEAQRVEEAEIKEGKEVLRKRKEVKKNRNRLKV